MHQSRLGHSGLDEVEYGRERLPLLLNQYAVNAVEEQNRLKAVAGVDPLEALETLSGAELAGVAAVGVRFLAAAAVPVFGPAVDIFGMVGEKTLGGGGEPVSVLVSAGGSFVKIQEQPLELLHIYYVITTNIIPINLRPGPTEKKIGTHSHSNNPSLLVEPF